MGATFGWNLALLSVLRPTPQFGDWALAVGLGLALTLTLYSMIDVFKLGIWNRTRRARSRRNTCFLRATDHYLKREWREAQLAMEEVLDMDPADPAARLFLSSLERRRQQFDRAIRHAQKALYASRSSPYAPELEREQHLAREARRQHRRWWGASEPRG